MERNYKVIFASDATATLNPEMHKAALDNVGILYGTVASTEAIIDHISKGGRNQRKS
jgi:nicotinamidase-related amidase